MLGPIKSWSYSTYTAFQRCPRKVYMDKVLKEPQLPLEPPEGKDEHPLTRGSRVHTGCELYVTDGTEMLPEMEHFAVGFENLRILKDHPDFDLEVEGDWAFTKDWQITGWSSEDAYLRMKADCLVIRGEEAIVIDYKTGRRYGNEISHMMQAQLYQLATLLRYPEIEHITTEHWYLDAKEIATASFTRQFGMRFLSLFTSKGEEITNEIRFNAKPSAWACKFCPYGVQNGTGTCALAYC